MRFSLEDYEPVEDRLARFWDEHPEGRVHTDLIAHGDGGFIVRAEIWRDAGDPHPWATGWAEERISERGVNAVSALENCETSAIGRALANAGYAPKGKRPSREEMSKAARGPVKAKAPEELIVELGKALDSASSLEELEAAKKKVGEALARFEISAEQIRALGQLRDASAARLEGGQA
jgi:hypothetical protein